MSRSSRPPSFAGGGRPVRLSQPSLRAHSGSSPGYQANKKSRPDEEAALVDLKNFFLADQFHSVEHRHHIFYCTRRRMKQFLLIVVQIKLNDLLDSVLAKLHRNPKVDIL